MFKDYYEMRAWLENFIPYTYSKQNLGLERIEYLLKLLGNPEKKFKSILVGGTSGKGSTAFYIAKLLEFSENSENSDSQKTRKTQIVRKSEKSENQRIRVSDMLIHRHSESSEYSGLKIGLHLSPHLSYIGERMQINGVPISPLKLIRLMGHIKPIVEEVRRVKPDLTPSYFEILVAASFLYFAQEKVDWAVVEVGLGGRLDATNVLEPELSVITNVGLDHTDILGNTIEKIAFEKAGIIKSNTRHATRDTRQLESVLVITGASGKALKVIEKVAKEKKARLIKVDTRLAVEPPKTVFKDYLIIYKDIERYIGKSFAYQNFLLALNAVLALGFRPSKEEVLQISKLALSGRFEEIEKGVILDGAHNVDKLRFLIEQIKNRKQLTVNGQLTLIVAFKKGKDWKKMVDLLIDNLSVKKVIATRFSAVTDTGRFAAVEPQEIAAYVHSKGVSLMGEYSNSQEAVFEAINECVIASEAKQSKTKIAASHKSGTRNDASLVLVTGSLYLVGEARTLWYQSEF